MANLNVNIAKKLISYVRHGVDINSDIKELYNNSLIFIGDESQIYVPALNTYVGIGTTSYNATIDRIAAIEDTIDQLSKDMAKDMVTKIFANYSEAEVKAELAKQNGPYAFDAGLATNTLSLNNDITFKGINDYDPTTGFTYTGDTGHQKKFQGADGEYYLLSNVDDVNGSSDPNNYHFTANSLATSGITVTPHLGKEIRETNPTTGQMIVKRTGNYITIDDKATWSYMTSAYAYTLNYAKKYTASEIDRLYHNLLGDSVATYLPVGYSSVFTNITTLFDALSEADKANYGTANGGVVAQNSTTYYFVPEGDYYYATYTGTWDGEVPTSALTFVAIDENGIAALLDDDNSNDPNLGANYVVDDNFSGVSNFPQLYTLDTQYNSTYNMNIADGINTLKEVAYLLDKLTDGHLGSVTYFTYAEINAAKTDSSFPYASYVSADGTWTDNSGSGFEFHLIDPNPAWHPADNETYAYVVNKGNPDDLGIQIAYSIAGNKTQIDDLHRHAELLEKGKTTLRSIKATDNNFASIKLEGGSTTWANTDVNQGGSLDPQNLGNFDDVGHPNRSSSIGNTPAYMIGDINLKIDLNLAYTYATANGAEDTLAGLKYYESEFGTSWIGTYTLADMNNLDPAVEYFEATQNGSTYTLTYVATPILNPAAQTNQQYWYSPTNSSTGINENLVFVRIPKDEWFALADSDYLPGSNNTIRKSDVTVYYEDANAIDAITLVNDETAITAANRVLNEGANAIYYVSGQKDVEIHAGLGENALATTEWTGAFVDSKIGAIADDLENTLEKAKQYTDSEIGKLDSEYKYSDFETLFWNDYVATGDGVNYAPGTVDYNNAYAGYYSAFSELTGTTKDTSTNPGNVILTYNSYAVTISDSNYNSSLRNRTGSEYTYNIIQENGIVTAESRELPSDRIIADAEIWGEENVLTGGHQYEPVVLPGKSRKAGNSLFERLYSWARANAASPTVVDPWSIEDNQLFVIDASNDVPNEYRPLDPTAAANSAALKNNAYFEKQDGAFVAHTVNLDKYGSVDYSDVNNVNWVQLYEALPGIVELDLHNAQEVSGSTTSIVVNPANKHLNKSYTLTVNGTSVDVTTVTTTGVDDAYGSGLAGKLLYVKTYAAKSVKYFETSSKHHNYAEGGNGENTLAVKAHITRIEDAAKDNTGFADAYDVQSYIDNLFNIIDISASVPASVVNTSAKYHKKVTLSEYEALCTKINNTLGANPDKYAWQAAYAYAADIDANNKPVLYAESSGTFGTSTPNYAWFWKDDNTFYSAVTASNSAPTPTTQEIGIHVTIGGEYLYKQFNATVSTPSDVYDAAVDNYYIRTEVAKINPLNLATTLYV